MINNLLTFRCFNFQFQVIIGPKSKNNHLNDMKYKKSLQLFINWNRMFHFEQNFQIENNNNTLRQNAISKN